MQLSISILVAMSRRCDPTHPATKVSQLHATIAGGAQGSRLTRSAVFRRHAIGRRVETPSGQTVAEATGVKTTVYTLPTEIVVGTISESLKTHIRSFHYDIPRKINGVEWAGSKIRPIG